MIFAFLLISHLIAMETNDDRVRILPIRRSDSQIVEPSCESEQTPDVAHEEKDTPGFSFRVV